MIRSSKKLRFYLFSFLKHDFKASISVFFVALPLCLGVALASNAPVYSGLIAGIIGGILIGLVSKSSLSVSGPAAGLTAICAAAITKMGAIEIFFLSVSIGGLFDAGWAWTVLSSWATSTSARPSREHWRRRAVRAVRGPEACCRSSSDDFAGCARS